MLLIFNFFTKAMTAGWLVLVLDDAATRVISSALTMYDIMERRVTLVEQLQRPRQPFKEMEAIYLISPTAASVNFVLSDFENEKKAKYGAVHLFFLDTVGTSLHICLISICCVNSGIPSRFREKL